MNRHDRRASKTTPAAAAAAPDDKELFVQLSDSFISAANKMNKKHPAPVIHMPMLYAAARYGAFIGKSVLKVPDREAYLNEMTQRYRIMLQTHLDDPTLG